MSIVDRSASDRSAVAAERCANDVGCVGRASLGSMSTATSQDPAVIEEGSSCAGDLRRRRLLRIFRVQRRAWFFTVNKPFEPKADRRRLGNDGKAVAEDGRESRARLDILSI
jgi:hypothetical protein